MPPEISPTIPVIRLDTWSISKDVFSYNFQSVIVTGRITEIVFGSVSIPLDMYNIDLQCTDKVMWEGDEYIITQLSYRQKEIIKDESGIITGEMIQAEVSMIRTTSPASTPLRDRLMGSYSENAIPSLTKEITEDPILPEVHNPIFYLELEVE
ncbi:MAG: hypothetical protein WC375_08545 [Methanomassiliicoccales archaeon]|jgi:hypothetical protein